MPTHRYEVKQFRGYYQGISPARFSGQGMNDEYNPGFSFGSGFVDDVLPTPYGELAGVGGQSSIMFLQFEDLVALHYWTPPRGGDYVFIVSGGRVFALQRKDVGWSWDYLMAEETATVLPVGDEFTYGCFEPYGDALYYADGVNPPLRISFEDTGWLRAKFMGVPVYQGEDLFSIDRKPIAAISSVNGASYTYAVTTLSKWGESPATAFRFRGVNTAADQNQTDQYGPMGFAPLLMIDWNRLDESVSHVNLYRDTILGRDLQFVARVPRGVSTYVDSNRDSELGFPIPLDNGKPSNFRLIRSWNDQMFGVGGYGRRNRLSVSRIFYPDVWPPQFEIDTGVIGDGEDITQLWVINGSLYVFCREKTFRLSGFSAEDYSLDLVSSYLGCLAPRSLAPYKNGVVLLTTHGVKLFDGSTYTDISQPVDAVLRMEAPGTMPLSTACGAVVGDSYQLCLNVSGLAVTDEATFPNRMLMCDLRTGEWGAKKKGSFFLSTPFRQHQSIVVGSGTAADSSRYLQLLSPDYPFDDHKRIIPRAVFKSMDFDLPDVNKRLVYIDIHYDALKECVVVVKVDREAPQIDSIEATYTPVFTETRTIEPSNTPTTGAPDVVVPPATAYWGGSWNTSLATAALRPHHVRAHFDKITGRTFSLYIQFQEVLGPICIQKLVFVYESMDPVASEGVFDAPGYGGA